MCKSKFVLLLIALSLLGLDAATARAQRGSRAGLIDETVAERHGLTRAWFARVQVDAGADHVAQITQQTSFDPKVSYTLFEVKTDDGKAYSYSERERGAFGRIVGVDGAKQMAQNRLKALKADGKKATLSQRVVPQTILMVQTERGALHVFDAEDGRTMWSRNVGRIDYPSKSAAANDKYVAMVNGITLYVFHRADGRMAWERKMGGAPTAGPALSKEYVFVPLAGGKIEGYRAGNPRDPAWAFMGAGQIFVQPVTTPRAVAWATDRGHMYVSRPDNPGVRFRLESRGAIVSAPAYRAPLLYAVSQDGFVYAVNETAGGTVWRYTAGMPINEQPVAIGKSVYVSAERGGMVSLDADTGKEIWKARQAQKFVAASPTRIYALDAYNRLSILDAASGGLVAQMATDRLDMHVINQHTDRIYLADSTGLIQCLREIDATRPTVYAAPPVGEEAPKAKDAKAKPGDMKEAPMEEGAEGAEKPMAEGEMKEGDMKEAPTEEAAPAVDASADKAAEEKPAEEMEKKDE